jgi:hypothetical protein
MLVTITLWDSGIDLKVKLSDGCEILVDGYVIGGDVSSHRVVSINGIDEMSYNEYRSRWLRQLYVEIALWTQ